MNETARAKQAWADYLALGPDRSLAKLLAAYRERRQTSGKAAAPTVRLRQLEQWSAAHDWQERLKAIADREATAIAEREAEYRRSIMEAGFGLAHERVKVLKQLATILLDDLTTDDPERNRRWMRDVKGIGKGEDFERVEIERFNGAEVDQLRGLLDDIAKETGGRVAKSEVTTHGTGLLTIREVVVHMPPADPGEADADGA